MSEHYFGEKREERSAKSGNDIPVWPSPKYQMARNKACEMIDSGKYGLEDADFWILMNETRNGRMAYSGLIISHNGCLKINDTLPPEKRFRPSCVTVDKEGWNKTLVYTYCCEEQGIFEVGEFSDKNGKNSYPYAMAVKRMFDRVVLKASKLAYSCVYSETESDAFSDKRDAPPASAKGKSDAEQKESVPDSPTGDEEIVPCSDCDRVIESVTRKDGSPWPVAEMVQYSTGRFGRPLCGDCMKIALALEKEEEAKQARLEADEEAREASEIQMAMNEARIS